MSYKELYQEKNTYRSNMEYVSPIPVGKSVDFLTLEEIIPGSEGGHRRGKFKCVCGKVVTRVIHHMLKKGVNPKSCGCKIDHSKKARTVPKKKGLDFDLANKFITGRL